MNKRILSVILTLIMLVSLVPAGAISASAAGQSISEDAITILKQLEGYSKSCEGKGHVFGYGTVCTTATEHTSHGEKEADAALRSELKELDAAVNAFASKNGLSLSQGQHDALVLFSFENGTAWTTGTGDFQTAIKSGARGSKFLNAICWWDASTSDDNRRKIEANMYLNGAYSSSVPSRFITVEYVPGGYTENIQEPKSSFTADELAYYESEGMVVGNYVVFDSVTYEGKMSEAKYQYYDTAENPVANIVPTMQNHKFMGWYSDPTSGYQVTSLTRNRTVYAHWQAYSDEPGVSNVDYIVEAEDQVRLYDSPNGSKTDYTVKGNLTIESEFIDENGIRWGSVLHAQKLYHDGDKVAEGVYITDIVSQPTTGGELAIQRFWIKLGEVEFNNSNTAFSSNGYDIDVTVTVTNAYVRVRAEDSIYSKELRKAYLGEQLRIVNTSAGSDGFLWGQIADADDDGVCEGWVALMYTDFESVKGEDEPTVSYEVIATATITSPVNGYVNVRSDAGTDNQIVGALPYQTRVDLYETKYVNGIRWGRYSGGWFCLSYAAVDGIDVDTGSTGVLAYAFVGDISDSAFVYEEPSTSAAIVRIKETFDYEGRTITNLTAAEGYTWGKIAEGWVKVTNNADGSVADVDLEVAKYYTVVDGVTVREQPNTSSTRVNNLVKGVEFNVNDYDEEDAREIQVMVVGDTIWGYAHKVGEGKETYSGWVNLASKYVARGDAPAAEAKEDDDEYTGLIGTIVGADNVNVRVHHATYSKILGKIARGTEVTILEEKDGWYRIDYDVDNNDKTDSWVVDTYVEVSKASTSTGSSTGSTTTSGNGTVETGLGIVANTYTGVNVRTAPGTGNPAVGKLLTGSTVEILEVTTYGASKWGRVTQGWICMDYVTMVTNYEILEALGGTANNGTNDTTTSSEVAIYTGTTNQQVNIRKSTSLNAEIVRTVPANTTITLHEILTVVEYEDKTIDSTDSNTGSTTTVEKKTSYWARVNDGYIYAPGNHINLDTLDEATYTVTENEKLNVRNNPGTEGTNILFELKKGDQVKVTKLQVVNGNVWGFIEHDKGDGWICLAYCTKGAVTIKDETQNNTNNNTGNNNTNTINPIIGAGSSTGGFVNNSSGYRYTGKVVNTNAVNVRATPSTTANITTNLSSGSAMVVYETTIAENMAWGRCDAGWVYLYYVDLTPCTNGAVDARVVFYDNTIAYSDLNCSSVAGTYSRMSVVDIYEIVGKMARTDLGWINVDNLL